MTRVLLLVGGNSDERAVSLRSGAAVKAALISQSYDVEEFDPTRPLEQADIEGINVVFPVIHGAGGEDGSLQAQLDKFDIPYVGTGAAASALCFDKWKYKELLNSKYLPTPHGQLVDESGFWASPIIKNPFVLKPNDGGSSIDNLLVREKAAELDRQKIEDLFVRHPKLLLEELIEGTEITVAVLGNDALPVIEIIPPASGEFDYENKYNGKSQELCPPVNVSQEHQSKAQQMAADIHKLTGCRDFSRTDIMIDKSGKLYVLETNTIPGMTDQSLFPKAALAAGINMQQLVDKLIKLALSR